MSVISCIPGSNMRIPVDSRLLRIEWSFDAEPKEGEGEAELRFWLEGSWWDERKLEGLASVVPEFRPETENNTSLQSTVIVSIFQSFRESNIS